MAYLYEVLGAAEEGSFPWSASERERRRLVSALSDTVGPALAAACRLAERSQLQPNPLIADFLAAYQRRPVVENKGGSGLNDSLWLYLLARALGPELIIESGTYRGHSSWLFRQACPSAAIHSFDLQKPDEGRYELADVRYYEGDWSQSELRPPAGRSAAALLFFDDHVSHARRLGEAAKRGFRLALFDDNFPAHQLHATGAPPVPTLAMLLDERMEPGSVIEWQRNGKLYRYHDKAEHRATARRLIAAQLTLPELASVTRHPPGSGLTLVRLADRS